MREVWNEIRSSVGFKEIVIIVVFLLVFFVITSMFVKLFECMPVMHQISTDVFV